MCGLDFFATTSRFVWVPLEGWGDIENDGRPAYQNVCGASWYEESHPMSQCLCILA